MFKVNNSVTKLTPKGLKVILLSVLLNVNRNFAAELAYLAIKTTYRVDSKTLYQCSKLNQNKCCLELKITFSFLCF